MDLLIKNGRVIDPATGTDAVMDILAQDGVIAARGQGLEAQGPETAVIDAAGCLVMPGLIDMHVHLRDPGQTHKETLRTGGEAAARGGFTAVCPMPNTVPVTDTAEKVRELLERAKAESPVRIYPVGAVTEGQQGLKLADIAGMAEAGAIGISEDGKSVMNLALYKQGMEEAKRAGILVMAHCEDKDLVAGGVIQEGELAEQLGLPVITNAVEDVITARDILLAREVGTRLHLCHCSTKDSVFMVRAAKEAGAAVSAEVCPHHFTLTAEDIPGDDANWKMNPPLRHRADVDALKEGLSAGIMDVISTDHAPHAREEKAGGFRTAPFGIVGLETAVPLVITELVEPGLLSWTEMAERMSHTPAGLLGVPGGSLAVGAPADITVIDPAAEWEIDPAQFASMGKNTPFAGRRVRGRVRATAVGGKIVYEA